MHSASRLLSLCGLVLLPGFGQTSQPTAAQLEALEVFAKRPTAQIAWSKEVGRIDSDKAHAVITALIVEDATQTPRQMRGVRIDLTEDESKDQVYTGEDLIDRLVKALNDITDGIPRFFNAESGPRSCFGSGAFWQQSGHAFSASQCVLPDYQGLSVGTGKAGFRFPGGSPALFAGAIERGRDELKKH